MCDRWKWRQHTGSRKIRDQTLFKNQIDAPDDLQRFLVFNSKIDNRDLMRNLIGPPRNCENPCKEFAKIGCLFLIKFALCALRYDRPGQENHLSSFVTRHLEDDGDNKQQPLSLLSLAGHVLNCNRIRVH